MGHFDTTHSEVRVHGPAWLTEGVAEFQAAWVLSKGSVIPYHQRREHSARQSPQAELSLHEMETYDGLLSGRGHFDVAVMAAELLAVNAGEESLIAYWTLLGPETPWQEAFQTAFGMAIEESYALFQEHRAAGFPELDLPPIGPSIEERPEVDRAALVALYNATNGANWRNNSRWLTDAPIGQWHGVTVNPSGRVSELHLAQNGLGGRLPAELGRLTNLQSLSLSYNELSGTLPQELTKLTGLTGFYFHNNPGLCAPVDEAVQNWLRGMSDWAGSGCAPADSVADRAVLETLYSVAGGGNWTDNTGWLSNSPMREWYGVTTDVDGRVTGLYLHNNDLSGDIPSELGKLARLQRMNLGGNDLVGEIPSELGDLSNLKSLSLTSNSMSGDIPSELGDLTNLTNLWLNGNQLSGEIPQELTRLTQLVNFYFDNNPQLCASDD